MKNVLLIFSIFGYFFCLNILSPDTIFYNPSFAKNGYYLSIFFYLLLFVFLIINDNLRYKLIFKWLFLILIAAFTKHYLFNIGNWHDYSLFNEASRYDFRYDERASLFWLQVGVNCIYLCYVIYSRWVDNRVACPNCKKLCDFDKAGTQAELLSLDTDEQLTHGRITKRGKLDLRYNSEIEVVNTYTYNGECEFCGHHFTFTRESSYSKNI